MGWAWWPYSCAARRTKIIVRCEALVEFIDSTNGVRWAVVVKLHAARPRDRPAYAELDIGRDQCRLDRRYAARIGSALPGAKEESSLLDLRGRRPVRWRGKQQRDSAQGDATSQAEPCSEGKKGQHVVPVAGLADLHGGSPSGSLCLAFKSGKRTGGRQRTGKAASNSCKKPAARPAAAPHGYIRPP